MLSTSIYVFILGFFDEYEVQKKRIYLK